MKKLLALFLASLLLLGSAATLASAEAALEPVTIKMWFHGSNVTDDAAVMEKVNAYLQEKLNVTLEPIWGTWANFEEATVTALNAGDDVDIYFTCSWTQNEFNKFAKRGMWVRLDDPANNLVEKYAQDLWGILPEAIIGGVTIEGTAGKGVYAVPVYKDVATQNCWDINVPMLTKYGFTLDDVKNAGFYGLGDILKVVKEGEGADFYPLLIEPMVLERMVTSSIIVAGDSGSTNMLSYYLDPADPSKDIGSKLQNKFATEEFKTFAQKVREYYLAGYISPTCAIKDQAPQYRVDTQLAGRYLIGTQSYAYGYEATASSERKLEVQFIPLTPPYVDTTSTQGAMYAISSASKNPDRAMMVLNLINSDPYLMTLLAYGVEGVHYTLDADGLVTFTAKNADFQPWRNGVGNITLLPPLKGEGVGFWDRFKEFYSAAKPIPIHGYVFDITNVETELAAMSNVAEGYSLALCAGAVDPAEKLPEFLQKLEDAGMPKYLEEANAQLTTFLSQK